MAALSPRAMAMACSVLLPREKHNRGLDHGQPVDWVVAMAPQPWKSGRGVHHELSSSFGITHGCGGLYLAVKFTIPTQNKIKTKEKIKKGKKQVKIRKICLSFLLRSAYFIS